MTMITKYPIRYGTTLQHTYLELRTNFRHKYKRECAEPIDEFMTRFVATGSTPLKELEVPLIEQLVIGTRLGTRGSKKHRDETFTSDNAVDLPRTEEASQAHREQFADEAVWAV